MLGGSVTARYAIFPADPLWDLAVGGNLFFVLQAVGGHHIGYLALCVTAENLTGGMAGTALITYISSLCSPGIQGDGDSVRTAFIDYIARPHRCGLLRGMAIGKDGLGMVLRDDERRGTAGTSSFPLGRTA